MIFIEFIYVFCFKGIRDETPNEEITRLKQLGAEFKKTNRGGLITFHGPGQLVAYPIINLKHFKTSVKWYVNSLEETVINLCSELGKSSFFCFNCSCCFLTCSHVMRVLHLGMYGSAQPE